MPSNTGFPNSLGFLTLNIPNAEKSIFEEYDKRYQTRAERGQTYGYASLGPDGKVPTSQLPASTVNGIMIVPNIAARDVLDDLYTGCPVFVLDASSDPSVGSGFAEYVYNSGTWIKIIDQNTTSLRLGVSKIIYVDANRMEPYEPDGTVLYPFKQIIDAVDAQPTGQAYCLFLMPGTYISDLNVGGQVSLVGLDRGSTIVSGAIALSGSTGGVLSNITFTNSVTISDKHDVHNCAFTSRVVFNSTNKVLMTNSTVTNPSAVIPPVSVTNIGTVMAHSCEFSSSGDVSTVATNGGKLILRDCSVICTSTNAPAVVISGGVAKMHNSIVINTSGSNAIIYNTNATATEPHELIDMFVTGNVVGNIAYLYIDGIRNVSGGVVSGSNISTRPASQISYISTIGTTSVTNVQQALDVLQTTVANINIPDVYTKTQLQTSQQAQVHWNNITSKPTIPDAYTKAELQTSGQAQVHYGNVTNKPSIPDAYTKAELQTSGQAQVHYGNVTNKPSIPDAYTKAELQTANQSIVNWANISNKPSIPDGYTKIELQTPGMSQVDYKNIKNVPEGGHNEYLASVTMENPVQAAFILNGVAHNVTSVVLYPNRGIPQTMSAGDVTVSYMDTNSDGDADAVAISLSSALRSVLDPGDKIEAHVVTDNTIHKM